MDTKAYMAKSKAAYRTAIPFGATGKQRRTGYKRGRPGGTGSGVGSSSSGGGGGRRGDGGGAAGSEAELTLSLSARGREREFSEALDAVRKVRSHSSGGVISRC